MDERRLYWVGRNRHRPDRSKNAGGFVAEIAANLGDEYKTLSLAAGLIGPGVDAQFREHCRVAEIRGSAVVIHVDSASRLMTMRTMWSNAVLSALQADRSFSRLRSVLFEFGTAGAGMTDREDQGRQKTDL